MDFLKQEEEARIKNLSVEFQKKTEELKVVSGLNTEENSIFADAKSKPDRSFKRKWLRIKPVLLGFFFKLPIQIIYTLISALILKWFGFNF